MVVCVSVERLILHCRSKSDAYKDVDFKLLRESKYMHFLGCFMLLSPK